MFRRMKLWVLCCGAILLLLSSCYIRPTPEQIQSADHGYYPDNYEDIVRGYYSAILIDPYSARYTFRAPKKAWRSPPAWGKPVYGWAVCGTVNAKNRMGGYVGSKLYYIMIRNGTIVYQDDTYIAADACRSTYGY